MICAFQTQEQPLELGLSWGRGAHTANLTRIIKVSMGFLPELDKDGHFKKQSASKKRIYVRRIKQKTLGSWQQRKRAFYKKHPKKCKICGSRIQIELHHIRYQKHGAEKDGDLVP